MSAFSADNTNSNFEYHHSAYIILAENKPKPFKAGCLAHFINNTFKAGLHKLDIDANAVVMKIYGHFSSSSVSRESLKEFVDFVELEWIELLKYVVPTHWLSLGKAVDRILKLWPALYFYFSGTDFVGISQSF